MERRREMQSDPCHDQRNHPFSGCAAERAALIDGRSRVPEKVENSPASCNLRDVDGRNLQHEIKQLATVVFGPRITLR